MRQLVPVLIVGAAFAMFCTGVALVTGMDTTFKVAGLLTVLCLAATAGINFRAERERARAEIEYAALVDDYYLRAGGR